MTPNLTLRQVLTPRRIGISVGLGALALLVGTAGWARPEPAEALPSVGTATPSGLALEGPRAEASGDAARALPVEVSVLRGEDGYGMQQSYSGLLRARRTSELAFDVGQFTVGQCVTEQGLSTTRRRRD